MKVLSHIYLVLAVTMLTACRHTPKPFDFTFTGPTSATDFLKIDQLTADRTKGIVISSDLTPTFGDTWNSHDFFKAMREEQIVTIHRSIPSSDPPISVKIYEFTNAVSGHNWYHGIFQSQASRQWEAESGEITLIVKRTAPSGMVFSASATLSNAVFISNGQKQKKSLDRITIQDIPVEFGRM